MQTDNDNKFPVQHRNAQLLSMFTDLGYNAKIIGDYNQPKVIIDDEFAISGFVQNRLYHFTTKAFGGDIIRTVNLNEPDIDKAEIDHIITHNVQRRFWRLSLKTDKRLFYVRTENGSPLFTINDSRYWFDAERLDETRSYLFKKFGIQTVIATYEGPLDVR